MFAPAAAAWRMLPTALSRFASRSVPQYICTKPAAIDFLANVMFSPFVACMIKPRELGVRCQERTHVRGRASSGGAACSDEQAIPRQPARGGNRVAAGRTETNQVVPPSLAATFDARE